MPRQSGCAVSSWLRFIKKGLLFMNVVKRATDILFSPKKTWDVIESEQTDVITLYTRYIMFLALIPVVVSLVGAPIVASQATGQTTQVFGLSNVVGMIVGYPLLLGIIYVLAWLVNKLSPRFGGHNHPLKAFQLVAYSATSGLVGGIFSIMPVFFPLALLALFYSFYLMFLGAPAMMKTPKEKAFSFAFMLLICALPISAVFGGVFGIAASLFR